MRTPAISDSQPIGMQQKEISRDKIPMSAVLRPLAIILAFQVGG